MIKEEMMSIFDRFRLDGRRLFVTGGSRGLGREMALAIADAGADVLITGRDKASLEKTTKDIDGFTVGVAMDYGGHDELLRTIAKLENKGLEINTENIEKNLDTKDMPMADYIIRTGGEKRLSGFMSWQSEDAEFYFTDLYFPDFGPAQLETAIKDFGERNRRYGGDSK